MIRTVIESINAPVTDGKWSLNFVPRIGFRWLIQHIAVQVSTYQSGALPVVVLIDGHYLCGSLSGQQDSADGTALVVRGSQTFTLEWISEGATFTGPTFSATATIQIDEGQGV